LVSRPENHNMHHRTSPDAIRFAGRCAISVFVSIGQKITTCIAGTRMCSIHNNLPNGRFPKCSVRIRTFMLTQIHIEMFVEMFEMEIVEKKGTSCRRLVLTPLKNASKTRSDRFVHPSKIFVWEG
jgi:hypothetical protein